MIGAFLGGLGEGLASTAPMPSLDQIQTGGMLPKLGGDMPSPAEAIARQQPQGMLQLAKGPSPLPQVQRDGSVSRPVKGPENVRSLINESLEEMKSDLPADFLMKVAKIESNFNPSAVSPTGAKGLFQFTGGTWKYMGEGKDRLNPKANTRAAIKLAENNRKYLRKKLGREPKMAEIYMAHNIGAGGAARLLRMDPNARVSKKAIGSNPFHNPKYLISNGRPATAGEAVRRYMRDF